MTEDEARIARNTKFFTWTGQPTDEFPAWLLFRNFATDGKTKMIIHLFDHSITVNLGDTIACNPAGIITFSSNKILHFPERSPTLVERAEIVAA